MREGIDINGLIRGQTRSPFKTQNIASPWKALMVNYWRGEENRKSGI